MYGRFFRTISYQFQVDIIILYMIYKHEKFVDVKPSIDEVNVESARSTSVSPVKPSHNPSSVPFSYTQRPRNNDCYPGVSEVRGTYKIVVFKMFFQFMHVYKK